jgi:glucose-6-phosphate isomerase/transaldolase/glucose-6-phosphate isomerase
MGLDITTLLDRADRMREGCASCVPAHENPGAWMGATMGTLASSGRDKLTIVTSPAISSYGLWAEQLIAESTGKEGKGIIPIAGEPLLKPDRYGIDRLFVYLRLDGNANTETDAAIEGIKASGQPTLVLELRDKYDLAAEFFRWEFATAVAGAVLGINPFDQPNVQSAKDATEQILEEYRSSGRLPRIDTVQSPADLLSELRGGEYLAIMAYLQQTDEIDSKLAELRRYVGQSYSIPTTVGYGPRFLHSTGQLHKGGPDTGVFLQITAEHKDDLLIPGEPYSFGVVADAQALGDLQALQSLGRWVAGVHLQQEAESGIAQLTGQLGHRR